VVGIDGALWFADAVGNSVGRITMDGAVNRYPIPTANSTPLCQHTGRQIE
jgi:virginiamycin B lyase